MKKGIIVAGNMIVDFLKEIDVYPEHSKLTTIRSISRSCGGLLCNCAIDIAKLDADTPVYAVGVTGTDESGDYVLEKLSAQPNIDISRVIRKGETAFTDVMYDSTNRTRTFFTYRGANALLDEGCFDFTGFEGSILHIGYILLLDALDEPDDEYGTAMARVLAKARKAGVKTSIDLVSEESDRYQRLVPPALKYTDYCIINETEASKITGLDIYGHDGKIDSEKIKAVCLALRELGVSEWVIIHSRDAGYGLDKDGSFYIVPSVDIPREMIKGTTGAGDAFASGALYAAHRGMDILEAMKVATAVASCSLLVPGATEGIPVYEEAMKMYYGFKEQYGEV